MNIKLILQDPIIFYIAILMLLYALSINDKMLIILFSIGGIFLFINSFMKYRLSDFEKSIYAPNGLDGVTIEILNRLYNKNFNNKYYVEFNAKDGSDCKTRILKEKYGWNGLLLDRTNENAKINLKREIINKENVNSILQKYNVPKRIDLLSIDTKYNDFYILRELIKNYKSDVIIINYNGFFLDYQKTVVKYDPNAVWDGTTYYGASLLSFKKLLYDNNYALIYINNDGTNAYFINKDVLDESKFDFVNNVSVLYKPISDNLISTFKEDTKKRVYITYEQAIAVK